MSKPTKWHKLWDKTSRVEKKKAREEHRLAVKAADLLRTPPALNEPIRGVSCTASYFPYGVTSMYGVNTHYAPGAVSTASPCPTFGKTK